MGVRLLADGRWVVAYRDPARGGRVRKEYFGRGAAAELAARARADEIGSRPYVRRTPDRRGGPRFDELAAAYCDAKRGSVAASTLSNTVWKLNAIILPELGHLQAIAITARTLDRYVSGRLASQVLRKGKPVLRDGVHRLVKRTTVHRELSLIQSIMNWAADPERRYISRNPVAGYEKPARDDDVIWPPTPAEARRMLEAAPEHLTRALMLSWYTGLRPGGAELFRLTWEDMEIDSEEPAIRIVSARKGGAVSRAVPIIDRGFLGLLLLWRATDREDIRCPPGGPVIHWRGRPVTKLRRSFQTAKRKAGITRRLRPYDFRHAFATILLGAGANLKATSEILGHTRTETTTRIYQHVTGDQHRAAVGLLPSLVGQQNVDQKTGEKSEGNSAG